MIFRELSNAAFLFSLRRPGAEIIGGGGVQTRGAPDKLSGRIIRPDSRFLYYPVSGRIVCTIRPDSLHYPAG